MSAISNARWIGISQAIKILLQFVGLSVLARFIPPNEYGVMAMATVVTNLAMLLRDMGTSAGIIQKESLNEETKETVFWFNVLLGVFLTTTLFAFSSPIAIYFKSQDLIAVLSMLAPVFIITSITSIHQALLERQSAFRTIAGIELSAAFVGLGIAIIAAINGAKVYSLVLQTIVTASLSSLQLWFASGWCPTMNWHHTEFRNMIKFSGNLSAFNFINYFARNADSIIIGRYLGASAIGAYSMAYKIMLFPLQSMTFVTSRALFPIMSRQQNSIEEMAILYLRAISFVAFITAPLMTGLFVLRDPFILFCFGSQWRQVADLLIWLAPIGFIQSIISTTGTVFMARGRTDILLKLGILGTILHVSAFMLGVQWGVMGVAICYLVSNILNALPALFVTMRQLKRSIFQLLFILAIPAVSACLMGLGIYQLQLCWPANSLYEFLAQVFIGMLLYAAISSILQRSNCKYVLRILNGSKF